MLLEEHYDADEILRDGEDNSIINDEEENEDVRELNLGNKHDAKENFNELTSAIGDEEDLWGWYHVIWYRKKWFAGNSVLYLCEV